MSAEKGHFRLNLTYQILFGMLLGAVLGLILKFSPISAKFFDLIVEDILQLGGDIFISLLKMLVVPVVLVSLICGASSIELGRLGRVGGKTIFFYILTTAIAVALGILFASWFGIGNAVHLKDLAHFTMPEVPPLKQILLNIFPNNPFKALVEGQMLQVILFAILFGMTLNATGDSGKKILSFFYDINKVMMKLVAFIMKISPYGVFCLIAVMFAKVGFSLIRELSAYFLTVLFVLALQLFGTYIILLKFLARINPIRFFKKMYAAMLFAFSVASSNASIPIVLETVEKKLGVKNSIASFVIPLGATINMDGTAIMQGVATVFIAHAYHIDIGLIGYLTVVLMAILASIGTAGIPSVGLITLTMVLTQVGLPVAGVALIIGVDRLLDMARTAVNISGDAVVACVVARGENEFDSDVFNDQKAEINAN